MRTAACLYVRDEVRNIAEWVAYHLEVGFDHLFIYDNNSTDGTGRVAGLFGLENVTVIPWSFVDAHAQYKAYDHCLARCVDRYDWVACIDVDEFIAFQPGWTLHGLLDGRDGCDAIAVHWAFFGSGGHYDYPSALTIEAFTHRARPEFGPNRHIKSIVRPGRAGKAVSPHSFATLNYQLANGHPVNWQAYGITNTPADYSICQFNHYFVRSRAHWADKIRRGYRDGTRDVTEFAIYDLNEVEDLQASNLAPLVKEYVMKVTSRGRTLMPIPIDAALFDPVYYLMRYPDVAGSEYQPDRHFWVHGIKEGRDPNPFLDSAWYTRSYLQADGSSGPPYLHFLTEGAARGYLPRPFL